MMQIMMVFVMILIHFQVVLILLHVTMMVIQGYAWLLYGIGINEVVFGVKKKTYCVNSLGRYY